MTYERQIVLKNGNHCLVRSLTHSDGQNALDNFVKTHDESADSLASYADECTFTAKQEAEFLETWADSLLDAEIGAFVDGVLVGTAGIHPLGTSDKLKHRCEFGVAVLKAYQHRGIGRALTEACVECAKTAGVSQIELTVVAANRTAVTLYETLGFTEYGRNDRGFRTRGGDFQTLILMKKEL